MVAGVEPGMDDTYGEVSWALSRKSVLERRKNLVEIAKKNPGSRIAGMKIEDYLQSFKGCLSLPEAANLRKYSKLFPGELADLAQNALARPITSRRGCLATIIRNTGINFEQFPHSMSTTDGDGPVAQVPRWMYAREQAFSMGFPISRMQQGVAHGARCCFSESVPVPPSRTRRSMTNQIGNSMHVNSIGAADMLAVLVAPGLGAEKRPGLISGENKRARTQ